MSKRVVEETHSRIGGPDILVHVAAQSAIKPILDFSNEDWQRDFSVNVDSAFELAKLVAPGMKAQAWGRIITIGSVYASFTANPIFYDGRGRTKAEVQSVFPAIWHPRGR